MLLKKELSVFENSYYEASVVRPAPCPPLAKRIDADVCVVGGGYAGISAALELRLRGYSVVLLEAQRIGWGASGRNGGQVLVGFGFDGEAAIEKQFSAEDAHRAWDISVEAVKLLEARLAKYAIKCDYTPGYLMLAVKPGKASALAGWADHVSRTYKYPLEWIGPEAMPEWVASKRYYAAIYDPRSGHVHPLKYCLALAQAARIAGVHMFEHSTAYFLKRGKQPLVKTAEGEVRCRFLVLAGNVYLGEYGDSVAPEISTRIVPVGSYIVATEPMGKVRANALMHRRPAASDTNFVLDYFRLSADHRLLFGGGETFSGATPRNLVARMRKRMLRVFPQLSDLSISHEWGGFIDMTVNKAPDFGRLETNIYYLQGFSGHGLALTGMAGKLVAETIAGQAERFDLFARIKHLPFPGGAMIRTPALALGMLYYKLRDLL